MHKHVSLRLIDLKNFVKEHINLFKPECEIETRKLKLKKLECQFNGEAYDGCQLLLLKLVAQELDGDTQNRFFKLFCDQFLDNTDVQHYKKNAKEGAFTGSSFANHPLNNYLLNDN